eukprot:scaffold21521_cov41-Prasinocladus_malaysianus.AAC.1
MDPAKQEPYPAEVCGRSCNARNGCGILWMQAFPLTTVQQTIGPAQASVFRTAAAQQLSTESLLACSALAIFLVREDLSLTLEFRDGFRRHRCGSPWHDVRSLRQAFGSSWLGAALRSSTTSSAFSSNISKGAFPNVATGRHD